MNTNAQPPNFDDLLKAMRDPGTTGVDVQNLPWPFCLLYNGTSYRSQVFFAPDPNSAMITANQFVQLLNQVAQNTGYAPLFSVSTGSCSDL